MSNTNLAGHDFQGFTGSVCGLCSLEEIFGVRGAR